MPDNADLLHILHRFLSRNLWYTKLPEKFQIRLDRNSWIFVIYYSFDSQEKSKNKIIETIYDYKVNITLFIFKSSSIWKSLRLMSEKRPTEEVRSVSLFYAGLQLYIIVQNRVLSFALDCTAKQDLTFVVDGSGSICPTQPCANWDFTLQFIHRLVDSMTIGPNDTRVAVIIFSSASYIQWNLAA